VFSWGRLILSHVRSRLSAQTTHSILCLRAWSLLGLIKNDDVIAAAQLLELGGEDSDYEMEVGWDTVADAIAK
jgi:hypothetical protein